VRAKNGEFRNQGKLSSYVSGEPRVPASVLDDPRAGSQMCWLTTNTATSASEHVLWPPRWRDWARSQTWPEAADLLSAASL